MTQTRFLCRGRVYSHLSTNVQQSKDVRPHRSSPSTRKKGGKPKPPARGSEHLDGDADRLSPLDALLGKVNDGGKLVVREPAANLVFRLVLDVRDGEPVPDVTVFHGGWGNGR